MSVTSSFIVNEANKSEHFFSFFLFGRAVACGILVPQTGIEPMPAAVDAQCLNHWTATGVPKQSMLNIH